MAENIGYFPLQTVSVFADDLFVIHDGTATSQVKESLLRSFATLGLHVKGDPEPEFQIGSAEHFELLGYAITNGLAVSDESKASSFMAYIRTTETADCFSRRIFS